MLASGLRLGAPAAIHENRGISWFNEFMARSKALNYRVGFIPVHTGIIFMITKQLKNTYKKLINKKSMRLDIF